MRFIHAGRFQGAAHRAIRSSAAAAALALLGLLVSAHTLSAGEAVPAPQNEGDAAVAGEPAPEDVSASVEAADKPACATACRDDCEHAHAGEDGPCKGDARSCGDGCACGDAGADTDAHDGCARADQDAATRPVAVGLDGTADLHPDAIPDLVVDEAPDAADGAASRADGTAAMAPPSGGDPGDRMTGVSMPADGTGDAIADADGSDPAKDAPSSDGAEDAEGAEGEDAEAEAAEKEVTVEDIDPEALRFLHRHDPAWIEERVEDLQSGVHKRAMRAARELPEAGRQAAEAVLPLLEVDDTEKRVRAILVIRDAGDPVAGAVLPPLLTDPERRVRYQAALALRSLYGRSFHYHHEGPEDIRRENAAKWAATATAAAARQKAREAEAKKLLGLDPDATKLTHKKGRPRGDDAGGADAPARRGCILLRLLRR